MEEWPTIYLKLGAGVSKDSAFSVKLTDLSGLIRIPSLAMATARRRHRPDRVLHRVIRAVPGISLTVG